MDYPTYEYIRKVSQMVEPHNEKYTRNVNPRVRTSPYVTEVRVDYVDKGIYSYRGTGYIWIYLDLSNGNVLSSPYRMGESEVLTNVIYLYNSVGISTDINTLQSMFEEWTTVHDMDFFRFYESNLTDYSSTSVIGKFINKVDNSIERSAMGNALYDSRCIKDPKWDSSMVTNNYAATVVSKKIYSLLRMAGKDYLFIYLKNTPSIIDKFKQSTGLDKLTNQGILDLGIKEFCCNIGLESFVDKKLSSNAVTTREREVNRINEALIDLGAIAQRFS